jgi:hypothetical protein
MHDPDEEGPFEPLSIAERSLLGALGVRDVRAVIVGGYAVRWHGHIRDVEDLDLVVDVTDGNLARCEQALRDAGVPRAEAVWFLKNRRKAKVPIANRDLDLYVDLLSKVDPYDFEEIAASAVQVQSEEARGWVISREQLIEAKKAAAKDPGRGAKRATDCEDLRALSATPAV